MTDTKKQTDDQTAIRQQAKARQRAGLLLAGTGIFWILALWLGPKAGLNNRGMALLDMFALAGFGLGLWMTFRAGRPRA